MMHITCLIALAIIGNTLINENYLLKSHQDSLDISEIKRN